MLDRKIRPGTAHSGHDLVRNQKNSMTFADFSHLPHIPFRRHRGAKCRSADELKNECCRLSLGDLNCSLDLRRIQPGAILASVGTAIAVRCAHMDKLSNHRKVDLASSEV